MKVIKNSGDIVDFDPVKLRRSLIKSGANSETTDAILSTIKQEVYEGITTKKNYKNAFAL